MKRLLIVIALLLLVAAIADKQLFPQLKLEQYLPKNVNTTQNNSSTQTVVYEESVITKVVEESLPSVVTVGISKTQAQNYYQIDPMNPFGGLRVVPTQKSIEANIGSGFIISQDGLIITNKHVVSDTTATYQILTNDNQKYNVEKIYRDPLNDLAILKINATNLKPLPLGDSTKLKLGQLVIAIGTPLGEFKNTVTQGIISGLGRGITAGSPLEGYVEKLDNVIQTDAPINPGNSGGPLLNSSGKVIGINTAVAAEGQNIGFAIPSDVIKTLMDTFNKNGGSFERPYIGVRYQLIDQRTAILNKVVQGAYVTDVISGSPADKANIKPDDIITEIDGQAINGDNDQTVAKLIATKKVGDKVQVKIWRKGQVITVIVTLETAKQ
ncbi:trypsin-like serine protease [Candidatus Roizmanbacteria bacterium]|nr:trypsin-like serine protease [Candidatus Roizmanbacteria bacterium]